LRKVFLKGFVLSGKRTRLLKTNIIPILVNQGSRNACICFSNLFTIQSNLPIAIRWPISTSILPMYAQGGPTNVQVSDYHLSSGCVSQLVQIRFNCILRKTISNGKNFYYTIIKLSRRFNLSRNQRIKRNKSEKY